MQFIIKSAHRRLGSKYSLFVPTLAAITILIFCAGGIRVLTTAVIAGNIYAPSVIYGVVKIINKNDSPAKFWIYISLYLICFLAGVVIGLFLLWDTIMEFKKR